MNTIARRSLLAGIGAVGVAAGTRQPAQAAPLVHQVSTEAELNTAIAAASPGDRIVMSDGVWTDLKIVIGSNATHGTSAQPISVEAENVGGVILTGTSTLELGRDHWAVDGLTFEGERPGNTEFADGITNAPIIQFRAGMSFANNSILINTTIDGCNPVGDLYVNRYQWVFLWGVENTVAHCRFVGKRNYHDLLTGDYVTAGARAHHIHHNVFEDLVPGESTNGFGTVTTGTGADATSQTDDHMVIERNLFLGCSGESEIISVKSSSNTVRHNTFVDCGGYISLRAGRDNDIHSNYFFANRVVGGGGAVLSGSGGIRVTGTGHRIWSNYIDGVLKHGIMVHNGWAAGNYASVDEVEIVNNTIVNSATTGILVGAPFMGGVDNTPPGHVQVANNVLSSADGALITYETAPVSADYEANLADGLLGVDPDPGITVADPLLQPTSVNGYTVLIPAASGPATDAAVPYGWVTTDVDGRPQSPAIADVGAHRLDGAPALLPPVSRDDAGPRQESAARRVARRRREFRTGRRGWPQGRA